MWIHKLDCSIIQTSTLTTSGFSESNLALVVNGVGAVCIRTVAGVMGLESLQ